MIETENLYQERLSRYVTALKNEKPDKIPIRPFVAEFTAKYAGFSCQEVTHDYKKAFSAARKCAKDFDWDAVVANMVYVWTGLTQAIGLKYYGIPGIDVPADTGFQYREPTEKKAFMRADEYDDLIKDPTAFLYNIWLPRVSADIINSGSSNLYRNNLALVKGGMAMLQYFNDFGPQVDLLREECGTVSAIAGILKAPFDILGDKLRGYMGLTMDMISQPDKVLKACEALMPHMYQIALSSSDVNKQVPIGYWMHRGCIPFISKGEFESHYWPTIKPILEELWKNGHQTLMYAEGDWKHHLDNFRELPEQSIVYHVDQGDIYNVHEKIGDKFCLSGGIPNTVLAFGTKEEVREYCKKVIDDIAGEGGYIMDASAIMQNDTSIENLKAMTDFTRDYGVYSSNYLLEGNNDLKVTPDQNFSSTHFSKFSKILNENKRIDVCIPWEDKLGEIDEIKGDEGIVERIWQDLDSFGHTFIWHCLLSF